MIKKLRKNRWEPSGPDNFQQNIRLGKNTSAMKDVGKNYTSNMAFHLASIKSS